MGTVYDQGHRADRIGYNTSRIMDEVKSVLGEWDDKKGKNPMSIADAIEIVKFGFHVSDRDAHDEQMSGIAQCLDRIAESKNG